MLLCFEMKIGRASLRVKHGSKNITFSTILVAGSVLFLLSGEDALCSELHLHGGECILRALLQHFYQYFLEDLVDVGDVFGLDVVGSDFVDVGDWQLEFQQHFLHLFVPDLPQPGVLPHQVHLVSDEQQLLALELHAFLPQVHDPALDLQQR
jgi:hypothetical protein